jgi:hypothetical protein
LAAILEGNERRRQMMLYLRVGLVPILTALILFCFPAITTNELVLLTAMHASLLGRRPLSWHQRASIIQTDWCNSSRVDEWAQALECRLGPFLLDRRVDILRSGLALMKYQHWTGCLCCDKWDDSPEKVRCCQRSRVRAHYDQVGAALSRKVNDCRSNQIHSNWRVQRVMRDPLAGEELGQGLFKFKDTLVPFEWS